ncbi:MAG: cob(I)yrinic acid a,c-diamide adenosyltransferase [Lachnospiraceae bacterium]|nr:cob(I)yrinic acid a,c-diamide adenosyltransferase [Lachnospiraceae bacterium]
MEQKGLIHIFTGKGKGKTSAAIGNSIRAAGQGRSVTVIQFLKGKDTGEYELLRKLEPDIKLFSFEKKSESFKELDDVKRGEELQNIMNGINYARKVLTTGECDLLVLDEALGLVDTGIISAEDLVDLIKVKPEETEMILTGINAGPQVLSLADDVTLFYTTVAGGDEPGPDMRVITKGE